MASKRKNSLSSTLLLLPVLFTLVTACSADPMYNLRETSIDPSMTLFQDGLTIPLGSSERIRLDTLINKFGPEISDYLKVGKDGGYMLCYDGSFSLDDYLRSLNIVEVVAFAAFFSSQTFTVPVDDLPDAFRDDNVCLDLNNPQLTLDINTNLGIPLNASLELVPIINGQPVTDNTVKLEKVTLPCSASSADVVRKRYCLCNDKTAVPEGYEFLKADLSKILRQIPDSIQIRIDANVGGEGTYVFDPKARYTFYIDYEVIVPMAFNDDFSMTTETEIDLSGIQAISSLGEFGITGQVVNETPLSLDVVMDILDEAGNVIPQSQKSTIKICGKGTSDLELYIAPSDKSKVISKARFTISITAVSNEPVKPSECLQFINLVAVAPKGIDIDPDLFSDL